MNNLQLKQVYDKTEEIKLLIGNNKTELATEEIEILNELITDLGNPIPEDKELSLKIKKNVDVIFNSLNNLKNIYSNLIGKKESELTYDNK
jgi:hypothetical protein